MIFPTGFANFPIYAGSTSLAAGVVAGRLPCLQPRTSCSRSVMINRNRRRPELAQKIGLDLSLEPEPVFDRLFPSTDAWLQDWKRHETEWKASLEELALLWVSRDPADVAELLAG